MRSRAKLHVHALPLLIAGTLLAVPAGAAASGTSSSAGSGGGGLAPPTSPSSPASSPGSTGPVTGLPVTGPPVAVRPGNARVQASGDGITIVTRASALLRSRMRFSGTVSSTGRRLAVEIERSSRQTGGSWVPTTQAALRPDGSFTAVWPTNHIGRFAIRAVLVRSRGGISRATPTSPALTVTVYRPSVATFYGPGFFGQRTACGQILRRSTLGVANRTLPCGTPVSLLYHGRTIVVPVIDRGPYANGADWDLTSATATALGISGTETIGAVSLPH